MCEDKAYYLGVDGGGTKTLAVLADDKGNVISSVLGAGSNFQSCGIVAAKQRLDAVINKILESSGVKKKQIKHAVFGLSGADRLKDFNTFHKMLNVIMPATDYSLVNDTIIALRAGTSNGIGVAVIAGTGANTIGCNKEGKIVKVGGLGPLTGDYGSAGQITEAAVVAAMKGMDGRAKPTALYKNLADAIGLEDLVDIIEFDYADTYKAFELDKYAPVVFKTANDRDEVAVSLLMEIANEMALAVLTALKQLFKPGDAVKIVLGGSVLQKSTPPILRDVITTRCLEQWPLAKIIRLEEQPVMGAVLMAMDKKNHIKNEDADKTIKQNLNKSYGEIKCIEL